MHELSITQSLLEVALQHAQAAGARRVTDLYIVIGDLSSVLDNCVQFYWDVLTQGTIASGSRLHFRRVAVLMRCQACGASSALAEIEGACPICGCGRLQVAAGDELYLDSIDIEPEPAASAERPR